MKSVRYALMLLLFVLLFVGVLLSQREHVSVNMAEIFVNVSVNSSTNSVRYSVVESISLKDVSSAWIEFVIPKHIKSEVLQFDEKTKTMKLSALEVSCYNENSHINCRLPLKSSAEELVLNYSLEFYNFQSTPSARYVSPEYIYVAEDRVAFPLYLVIPKVNKTSVSLRLTQLPWENGRAFLLIRGKHSYRILPITNEVAFNCSLNTRLTLFMGSFREVSDGTVHVYFPDEVSPENATEMLKWSEKVITRYYGLFRIVPFREYHIIIWPAKGDVGGNGFMNGLIISKPYNGLVTHEIAHSWFYNYASFGVLDEALATFSSLLLFDKSNYKILEERILGDYFSNTTPIANVKSVSRGYYNVLYYKGAFVFHSLQFVLGNETFFEGLRELLKECHERECNLTDVQDAFEKVSDQKLGWFFKEWFYTAKVPDYEVENLTVKRKNNEYLLIFEVVDKNSFTMPLEVEVVTSKEKLIKKVWVNGTAKVSFELKDKPLKIILDPNEWMVNVNKSKKVGRIEVIVN
ncbi:MAG: hypothetical protein H0Z18_07470 [Thermococcus sp.]|uniref:M1 family aminopeptidase n=1 Tax=Thermococcus sp. TaxID=35749 RepID=UPI001D65DA2F|nr:M1 family aminopeptidase [Thermococcus sp.]MBO8175079.1 hypothetical protein [Thermococcus sp.]